MEIVFDGLLAGLSVAVTIVKVAAAIVTVAFWLLSRWVLRKALQNAGVETSGRVYVPVLGDFHVISCLSRGGRFPFFSFNLAPIVPMGFVVLSTVSALFFPMILKLIVRVLGWFCKGAIYTRLWDLAEGREDGKNSWWGLASAVFPVVLVIKCLLMAFSANGVKRIKEERRGLL